MRYRHTDTKVQQEFENLYKEVQQLQQNVISPGTIQVFNTPVDNSVTIQATNAMLPDGWLVCNGQEVNINVFKQLFLKLGLVYGSTTINSFKLPNITTLPAKNTIYGIKT